MSAAGEESIALAIDDERDALRFPPDRFQGKQAQREWLLTDPPFTTLIWRHKKENQMKCSLSGLESRSDFLFFQYPDQQLPCLDGFVLLGMGGEILRPMENFHGVIALDATWRYAEKMFQRLHREQPHLPIRCLPKHFRTAYPRKQTGCPEPESGLATVEALYLAYSLLGKDPAGILDHYYWKETFLLMNDLPGIGV